MLVGGEFTKLKSRTVGRLVRLFQDGRFDDVFGTNNGSGFNGAVRSVLRLADGSILVGGDFTSFDSNSSARYFAKLTADGVLDTAFHQKLGAGPNNPVYALASSSDQKIYLGGSFVSVSGQASVGIAKLGADGQPDATFATNLGSGVLGSVHVLKVLNDGKILAGGKFDIVKGSAAKNIVKLESDGNIDTPFSIVAAQAFNGGIYALGIDASQNWILGGVFTLFGANTAFRLLRLSPTGSYSSDATPAGGIGNTIVKTIHMQNDGKIVVGGDFQTVGTVSRPFLVRFSDKFVVDEDFSKSLGKGPGDAVTAIAADADGKLFIGGNFTQYDSNAVGYLLRLK
jgi:uncharacterized delta-60 repeat protein